MRKIVGLFLVFILAFSFAGCASYPDISEADNELISEYSVSLLLKYDSENHSRLVDTSEFLNSYYEALRIREEGQNAYENQLKQEEEDRINETLMQEQLNASGNDTSLDSNKTDEYDGATITDNSGVTVSIESLLGCDNFSIIYTGYDIVDSYPEGSTDFFFSMDATEGNKLLVVKFDVTNLGEASELNIFGTGAKFKLNINKEGMSSVYKTMLEDDLSEYLGSFNSGEKKKLVLIYEIPEDKAINSISLGISSSKGSVEKALVQ